MAILLPCIAALAVRAAAGPAPVATNMSPQELNIQITIVQSQLDTLHSQLAVLRKVQGGNPGPQRDLMDKIARKESELNLYKERLRRPKEDETKAAKTNAAVNQAGRAPVAPARAVPEYTKAAMAESERDFALAVTALVPQMTPVQAKALYGLFNRQMQAAYSNGYHQSYQDNFKKYAEYYEKYRAFYENATKK